ncbi:MAG TPA: bb3-type cytochrome oxidase subunit III [Albitalea sp.]|jgi:cytochrome c oxidase subunit 3|nr:bb3-type cytochrome oxidase subunit III [Albitalea sp.]
MNTNTAVLRATGGGRDDVPGLPLSAARRRGRPQAIVGVGLWVFIGVATTLFALFISAYVMRLSNADAVAIAMPRQLWLSTALLVAGSVLLQRAGLAASASQADHARWALLMGGACAVAFIGVQWWAWQALLSRQVTPVGNPAGSFFFLLTAMHALHVSGGLVGLGVAGRAAWRPADASAPWRIALCARYWHFLLLLWLALYACFTWITPEVARIICRTGG